MNRFVVDSRVINGHLKLQGLPLEDIEVKVILIPKVNLSKMSFKKAQRLTKPIKGNLSDDITSDRNEK